MNHFSTKRDDRDQFSETGQNMSRSWLVLHVRGKKKLSRKTLQTFNRGKNFSPILFLFFFSFVENFSTVQTLSKRVVNRPDMEHLKISRRCIESLVIRCPKWK